MKAGWLSSIIGVWVASGLGLYIWALSRPLSDLVSPGTNRWTAFGAWILATVAGLGALAFRGLRFELPPDEEGVSKD